MTLRVTGRAVAPSQNTKSSDPLHPRSSLGLRRDAAIDRRDGVTPFNRTLREFIRNVRWVKVLVNDQDQPAGR